MTERPRFNLVDIVAHDYDATLTFYRRLGAEVEDGAGYDTVQCPYDTFWGARYAIVADPDGQHVEIMSPSDEEQKHWPPTPAPRSAD